MTRLAMWQAGDQVSLWFLNVVLLVTWVTILATGAALVLRRRPAARHGLLCAALGLVLMSPAIALWRQQPGRSVLSVSLAQTLPAAQSDRGGSEVYDHQGRDDSGTLPGLRSRRTTGRQRDREVLRPDDEFIGNEERRAVAEKPMDPGPAGHWQQEAEWGPETSQFAIQPDRREAVSSSDPAGFPAGGLGLVLRRGVPPLMLIWLVGTAILLVRLTRGYRRLGALLRSAPAATDAATGEALARAGRALGLHRLPELLLSDRVSGPISAGVFRPRILLPERIFGEITPRQLHDVLVHEMAHVARHDPLVVLLQNLAGAIFWVHPLVKVLNRQLAQAREELCDNYVLAGTDAPSYSRTLLKLATLARPSRALAGAVELFTSRWKLERRVAGMLDERRSRGTQLTWPSGALLSCLVATIAVVTAFGTVSVAVEQSVSQDVQSAAVPASPPRVIAAVEAPKEPEPWPARADDGLLTLNLTVRMPDGSPAAGARVRSLTQWLGQEQNARTDAAGRVTIRAIFGLGAIINASSADGNHQSTLKVPAPDVRIAFAKPVELILAPAVDHQVTVTSVEKPVANAQVVAQGHYFDVTGTTGRDGVAKLKLPADEGLNEVSAWHAALGVGGVWNLSEKPQQGSTRLALEAPAPLTVHFSDRQGNPVPDLDFCMTSLMLDVPEAPNERQFIVTQMLAAARLRTNEQGQATVPWAPRERLKHVNVDLTGAHWKVDEIEPLTPSKRVVSVQVCRLKPVAGRLIMPEGMSAEGLLITGLGSGPGGLHGDAPDARARWDGSFEINVAANHGYMLGLFDREWTCEPWTGTIFKSDDDEPAELALVVRRATPVTVRVTRGSDREPVAGAWVNLQQPKDFQWTDAAGKKHNGGGRIGGWLKTDAQGLARAGVGRGTVGIQIGSGGWYEERTIAVTDDKPVEVAFHRPWQGDRKGIARMTRYGAPYQPSQKLAVYAWTDKSRQLDKAYRPIVRDDHAIEVSFDEKHLSLLAIDREKGLSGFVKLGDEGDTAELVMQPTATYSGTLFDEKGKPLAGRTLRLETMGSFLDVAAPQETDAAGNFRFTGVPVGVPLRIEIKNEEEQPKYSLFDRMLLDPGEERDGGRLEAYRQDAEAKAATAPPPLAERLKNTCENVRVAGMHAVVVLQGDDSRNVIRLTDRVLGETDEADGADADAADSADEDDDDLPVYNYLPITVAAPQVQTEAAFLKEQNWPRPNTHEIVLLALDGRQKLLASATISAGDLEAAKRRANEFLSRHKPEFEDARSKLAKGREQAQRDGRRVWVISSGPRCGPCFRLARWIDRHHETLEKDYVIVKLMNEPHAVDISNEIGGEKHGIPWFVITEPDGKIIVTSEGPLGNIGMPGGVEDVRHFRKMLERTSRQLSADDIEKLMQSLSPQK